ncbi:MAG: Hsp70 family protein [Jatrophihabitans sp.]|uniref:Hsp70 family protein n=1 Tax=Jatrophihabitans sp. TaxID=1932789 RepID=UPI003F811827
MDARSAVVGIDLGTTYSAVAALDRAGKPQLLPNREGDRITPSVVLFNADGTSLVGATAKRAAPTAPDDVAQFVKRQLGDPAWRFRASSGQELSAEQISAIILRQLKDDAEEHLGVAVTEAVITVPAYFDDVRRRATRDAGALAGLDVLRVINEPTAAALAFGLDTEVRGTYVVFDLGGGTFDVTVLRINGDEFEVLATDGLHELGGVDWDERLVSLLNRQFMAQGGPDLTADPGRAADLRERAELAKRALTQAPQTRVALSAAGVSAVVPVTRAAFEQASADLVNQTRDLTVSVAEDVGLSWRQVDGVLLAGGATRMPMIRRMLEQVTGRAAMRVGNPDELVALGAAIRAGLETAERRRTATTAAGRPAPPVTVGGRAVTIRDVTSHGLGTIALGDDGRPQNVVLIPRNSPVPARHAETFTTAVDGQREVRIAVTQCDETDPAFVRRLGPPRGQAFPLPPYPAGAPIQVAFAYDIDQTVSIEITDLATGQLIGHFEIDYDDVSAPPPPSAGDADGRLGVGGPGAGRSSVG